MSIATLLQEMRDVVQQDIGARGLAHDPVDNLLTATAADFATACRSIAEHPSPRVGIVTGFMIPSVTPPTGETDGPPGALFLAQAFAHLGIPCVLASDASGMRALQVGREFLSLPNTPMVELTHETTVATFVQEAGELTHLIALERSGPSHADGSNYTMRGRDITALTAPAHRLFEGERPYVTIGIGDGGNEIGMGKIARDTIAKNIPHGAHVACRTATDYLIVAGISNWGAYALAGGVLCLREQFTTELFDVERERALLTQLVRHAPLVDGVTGQFTVSVDGVAFTTYMQPFEHIRTCGNACQ